MSICYFIDSYLDNLLKTALVVALDMNGLIVDDEGLQLASVNKVLQQMGIEIDEQYWIKNCVGKKADVYFSEILNVHGIKEHPPVSILIEEKNKTYHNLISRKVDDLVRPGVIQFINYFYEKKNPRLALITAAHKSEVDTLLGNSGLNLIGKFDFVISGEEVKKSKPNPEIYIKLIQVCKVKPSECLVFEDSAPGVEAAFRAGMLCIAVPNRYTRRQNFNHAHCIISNMSSEARILKKKILKDK